MIQIRLGVAKTVNPDTDLLGRKIVGWDPEMTPVQAWEAARLQVLNPNRALVHETAQIINGEGVCVAVAKFNGLTRFWPEPGQHKIRYALQGEVIEDPRLGEKTAYEHVTNNSVMYVNGVD